MRPILQIIAEELSVQSHQVEAAVALLDEGATVPFIARYRKEVTGTLDDTQLRHLEERLYYLRELEERRAVVLNSIREQDKLTPELEAAIQAADTKTRLEDLYLPWLGLSGPALIVVSLMSVWQFVGIPMLLFSAALLAISDEILEAARVDGATSARVFRSIQLPLIAPTIGIVAVLTYVGNFNAFDLIYTVEGGLAGPDYSTDVMGTFFFRTFFGHQLQLGDQTMGATVAGMMFLIILAGVLIYLFGVQRRLFREQG